MVKTRLILLNSDLLLLGLRFPQQTRKRLIPQEEVSETSYYGVEQLIRTIGVETCKAKGGIHVYFYYRFF